MKKNPPELSHIDSGFYRVSDAFAGRLAKTTAHGKLPRLGYELTGVKLPDGRTGILIRTPHRYRTDSPKRGWVWAVYHLENARSNPPRPQRMVKLSDARVRQLGKLFARKLPKGSALRRHLLAKRNPRRRPPANVDSTLLKLATAYRKAAAAGKKGRGVRLIRGRAMALIWKTYPLNERAIEQEWNKLAGFVSIRPNPRRSPRRRRPASLGPIERHQLRIAEKTQRMPAPLLGVMGGPSAAEAQATIARLSRGGRIRANPRRRPIKKSPAYAITPLRRSSDPVPVESIRPLYVHAGWNKLKLVRVHSMPHTLDTRHGPLVGYMHRRYKPLGAGGWDFTIPPGVTIGFGDTVEAALKRARDTADHFRTLAILRRTLSKTLSLYTIVS